MERAEDKMRGNQTSDATSDKTLKDVEETQELPDDRGSSSAPSPDGQFDEGREKGKAESIE